MISAAVLDVIVKSVLRCLINLDTGRNGIMASLLVAQVFFSVVDVALVIKSWLTKHPLIQPIDNFINQLEASIESTQNQLNSLEIFRGC